MKRIVIATVLLTAAAGFVYLQTPPAAPQLAKVMPGGALLYLETPDFARLLREWDSSKVKADWLVSANFSVFSRSNLFTKLQDVYNGYGAAAGFMPGLSGVREIAGDQSALALYDIRDVHFLYVTQIGDGDLMKSQLWAVRDKFEQRQAGGVSFYLRADPQSQRTVAFGFTKGYLLLSTREDLVGQALELFAGKSNPSIAADRWYRDAAAVASNPGELRMAMNLESLVKSDYFRSYWVQRNISQLRRYWTGVADVRRTAEAITETRVFLHAPDAAQPAPTGDNAVAGLVVLVPPDSGMYKTSSVTDPSAAAALIVHKLIAPDARVERDARYAPGAASPDSIAGSEADLETRIDEQPLPADAGIADSIAAVRGLIEKSAGAAVLLVQSSAPATGTFIQTPATIVIAAKQNWDRDAVRTALAAGAGKLWTTAQLGAGWISTNSGSDSIDHLDGLGNLVFATRGRLLFVSNGGVPIISAVLSRAAGTLPTGSITYAAGFRHLRERSNYALITTALDFSSPAGANNAQEDEDDAKALPFFSKNLDSLSHALQSIIDVQVQEEERGAATVQTVTYRLAQ